MDKTADRANRDLADQPEVQGELLNVSGWTYWSIGELAESETAFRQALVVQRKALVKNHPDLADTLFGLAQVLYHERRPEESEVYYRESLEIRRKLFGNEHWTVAACLNNLSSGPLRAQGKWAEAESYSREGLAMKRQILAKNSAGVITTPKPDQALGIKPQIPAGDERELAISLRDLGLILHGEGKLAEAEGLYREALATFRRASGDRHPDVAFTLAWLAKLLSEEERLAEAETAFRDALAIQRKLYDSESLTVADTLNGLSGLLQKEGKLAEAESASREAMAILEKKKPDDWETFDKRSILGGILLEQKKYAEAEPLLVSASEGLTQRKDKLPPRGKLRPKEVLQRLMQLYEATSRRDQAAEWKKKLAEANALLEGQTNTPAEKKLEPH